MPPLDACHGQLLNARQRDGCQIVGQNERFYLDGRIAFIDLKAVRGANGNRQQSLLSEIKCFPEGSTAAYDTALCRGKTAAARTRKTRPGINRQTAASRMMHVDDNRQR